MVGLFKSAHVARDSPLLDNIDLGTQRQSDQPMAYCSLWRSASQKCFAFHVDISLIFRPIVHVGICYSQQCADAFFFPCKRHCWHHCNRQCLSPLSVLMLGKQPSVGFNLIFANGHGKETGKSVHDVHKSICASDLHYVRKELTKHTNASGLYSASTKASARCWITQTKRIWWLPSPSYNLLPQEAQQLCCAHACETSIAVNLHSTSWHLLCLCKGCCHLHTLKRVALLKSSISASPLKAYWPLSL